MRDARREAFERVDGRFDVRVLEPSPPAVDDPPWFADDPLDGGEVLPIARDGTRTWADIADGDLRAWCADRWLIRRPLEPLPPRFAETRAVLHGVAETRVSPPRQQANGKIGLRFTYHGFGTPFFAQGHQVRVEDNLLLTDDAREQLDVDPVAARALGDWYGFCASVLEQWRADATDDDAPSRVQLWPEHFDMAVDLGPDGRRANYGGSPGDEIHPEPYLYVGPWQPPAGGDAYWNEPFGASLTCADLLAGADPLEFFRRGKELLWQTNG